MWLQGGTTLEGFGDAASQPFMFPHPEWGGEGRYQEGAGTILPMKITRPSSARPLTRRMAFPSHRRCCIFFLPSEASLCAWWDGEKLQTVVQQQQAAGTRLASRRWLRCAGWEATDCFDGFADPYLPRGRGCRQLFDLLHAWEIAGRIGRRTWTLPAAAGWTANRSLISFPFRGKWAVDTYLFLSASTGRTIRIIR